MQTFIFIELQIFSKSPWTHPHPPTPCVGMECRYPLALYAIFKIFEKKNQLKVFLLPYMINFFCEFKIENLKLNFQNICFAITKLKFKINGIFPYIV